MESRIVQNDSIINDTAICASSVAALLQQMSVIIIMQHSHITEEDERSSISLHDNTLIQIYDNLDYSDQQHNDSSSQDRSLSLSRRHELAQITQLHNIRVNRPPNRRQLPTHHRQTSHQPQQRHFSDLESKYELGVSPSTKEENSILKANEYLQHRNFPIRVQELPEQPDPRSYIDQYMEVSKGRKVYLADRDSQESIDSGREARLGVMARKKDFNIDSWLNPQPEAPRNKKGVQVLSVRRELKKQERVIREKYETTPNKVIMEEESITLITLPEGKAANDEKLAAAILRGESQLQTMTEGWQHRFNQARLNFMDSFLPPPLKIKNNAYNLLKHINNRVRI